MMRTDKRLLFCLAVMISTRCAAGTHTNASVPQISSQDQNERVNAASAIRTNRRSMIQELTRVVEQEKDDTRLDLVPSPKYLAIRLLGDLKADDKKTLLVLFQNLDYEIQVTGGGYSSRSLSNRYPAVGSLIKIGTMPVVERALSQAKMSPDKTTVEKCAWIIRCILGQDLAKLMVRDKLKYRQGPVERKNLELLNGLLSKKY